MHINKRKDIDELKKAGVNNSYNEDKGQLLLYHSLGVKQICLLIPVQCYVFGIYFGIARS